MKNLKIILLMVAFICGSVFSQSDFTGGSKRNMPGDWGKQANEKSYNYVSLKKSPIPGWLLEQYANAKLTRNQDEKLRVGEEIQKYLEPAVTVPPGTYTPTVVTVPKTDAPFSQDWYNTDVQVYSGDVASNGFRQLDLKRGEDGWLYLAVNRRNVSGNNGSVSVYRSSNGGINWVLVVTASNSGAYFANVSMSVEKRHATIDDSTRITLVYTRSGSSNMNDGALEVLSIRRTGAAVYVWMFATPPSGHKYEYPSVCSDGMYWDVATYIHVICREVSNDGNTYYGMRHFLTTNFGISFTNVLINTYNNDFYPSAAYCEKGTGNDSIYIAVERRISSTVYEIRAIITCEWLTTNHFAYYITSAPANTKYERPCITVQQQQASVPRRILITYTRNNLARYCISTNGGQTWQVDGNLGTNGLADYTWCNSDSLTAGDGYAIACFVDQNGDSITVRRGNMTGSLGSYIYKRNSNAASGILAPVCAVYKTGTSKYSAFAYPGYGPTNLYFNQENIFTGITPISNIAETYSLSQNYPNPFNPNTNINFGIPKTGMVKLIVYDIMGKEVSVIVNSNLQKGIYSISFDGSALASGIYIYKLIAGEFSDVKKMILVK